ncbi:MAG: RNA ligase [Succinimonas sp.]|nr:RNA ligase [Succinimonas sp.]
MNKTCAISLNPADYSQYEKIIIIGDIHGCCTVLKEALGEINPRYLYIFLGDYLDRGLENRETLEFFIAHTATPNFIFIEGNHEPRLRSYAEDQEFRGWEFTFKTVPQIKDLSKKDIRQFCRRLRQCAYFSYGGRVFLVCHGGIPKVPPLGLIAVSASGMINGVGVHDDYQKVAEVWHETMPENFVQVFGHRNTGNSPARLFSNVFCLEGLVEKGGCLRTLELSPNGVITPREYQNTVFNPALATGVPDLVQDLRRNRYIIEKNFGHISSFNFSDKAFEKGIWNEQTVTARGLFIDVVSGFMAARGYRKFFNIGERPETRLPELEKSMKFPAEVYVKENGFLGLMSWYDGKLFTTSKSNPESAFAGYFRDLLQECCPRPEVLREYLEQNRATLLFECIDVKRDPHIIRYPENRLVLLDIIDNKLEFARRSYQEVCDLAARAGLPAKRHALTLSSFAEFQSWYRKQLSESLDPGIPHIEGYVIEDARSFMLKLKLPFYAKWKNLRIVAGLVYNRREPARTLGKHSQRFYDWLTRKVQAQSASGAEFPRMSIPDLRDMYVAETGDRFLD